MTMFCEAYNYDVQPEGNNWKVTVFGVSGVIEENVSKSESQAHIWAKTHYPEARSPNKMEKYVTGK